MFNSLFLLFFFQFHYFALMKWNSHLFIHSAFYLNVFFTLCHFWIYSFDWISYFSARIICMSSYLGYWWTVFSVTSPYPFLFSYSYIERNQSSRICYCSLVTLFHCCKYLSLYKMRQISISHCLILNTNSNWRFFYQFSRNGCLKPNLNINILNIMNFIHQQSFVINFFITNLMLKSITSSILSLLLFFT